MTSGVTARVRGGDGRPRATTNRHICRDFWTWFVLDRTRREIRPGHPRCAVTKALKLGGLPAPAGTKQRADRGPHRPGRRVGTPAASRGRRGRVPCCADDGFDYVDLFDDPFYLVLRRDDPLAGRKRIDLERIAAKRILGGPPWGPDLRLLCNRCGFEPRFGSKYRTTDFSAFQSLVAAGLGVTLMPRLAFGSIREDVVLRRLDPAPVRHVKLAVRASGYRSSATEAMLRGLVATVRDLPTE